MCEWRNVRQHHVDLRVRFVAAERQSVSKRTMHHECSQDLRIEGIHFQLHNAQVVTHGIGQHHTGCLPSKLTSSCSGLDQGETNKARDLAHDVPLKGAALLFDDTSRSMPIESCDRIENRSGWQRIRMGGTNDQANAGKAVLRAERHERARSVTTGPIDASSAERRSREVVRKAWRICQT